MAKSSGQDPQNTTPTSLPKRKPASITQSHVKTSIDQRFPKNKIDNLEGRSPQLREALLREVNIVAINTTKILGIIVRSSSTRNAFEFYSSFLSLCRKALDENCKLILSSEWDYIPFTFPQNLQELPNFVIIGLPASESDNTLVFPVAGHELGHSIWLKEKLQSKFQPILSKRVLGRVVI